MLLPAGQGRIGGSPTSLPSAPAPALQMIARPRPVPSATCELDEPQVSAGRRLVSSALLLSAGSQQQHDARTTHDFTLQNSNFLGAFPPNFPEVSRNTRTISPNPPKTARETARTPTMVRPRERDLRVEPLAENVGFDGERQSRAQLPLLVRGGSVRAVCRPVTKTRTPGKAGRAPSGRCQPNAAIPPRLNRRSSQTARAGRARRYRLPARRTSAATAINSITTGVGRCAASSARMCAAIASRK
jgi:hypothetical protein